MYTSTRHHPLTYYPLPPRPLVRVGQTSHRPHTSRGLSHPQMISHVLHYPPPAPVQSFVSALREECPRTTTGVSQRWFSGHFRQVFFNTIALPRINIGADVWGESSIMTGVYQRWCSSTLHIGWDLCDRVCQVLVCRGRYGLGGRGSSLHSGIEFGRSRVGPVRGLRGRGRRGWCEEEARSG
jgi:hypothetical protein